jgi:hypothetical protein
MKTLLSFIILGLACVSIQAQKLYPISGGTGTEPDPKDKKIILLVAENEGLKLTLGRSEKYKPKSGLMALWLKIENRTDKPLSVDPAKFNYVDDEGRGYSGFAPKDAIKKALDSSAGKRSALGMVLAGPLAGPAMMEAAERKVTEDVNREAIQPGEIPAHSFKDGIIFFEAPKKKQTTIKVALTDLWPEPFIFSTEKPKK